MTRPEELRRYLYTAGFSIQEEEIVRDGHRLYTVIAAAYTGECLEPGPALLHIGRVSRGETAYLSRIRDRLLRQAAGLSRAEDLSRRREVEALRRTAGWIGRYMEGTWTPASETAMTVDVVHRRSGFPGGCVGAAAGERGGTRSPHRQCTGCGGSRGGDGVEGGGPG